MGLYGATIERPSLNSEGFSFSKKYFLRAASSVLYGGIGTETIWEFFKTGLEP